MRRKSWQKKPRFYFVPNNNYRAKHKVVYNINDGISCHGRIKSVVNKFCAVIWIIHSCLTHRNQYQIHIAMLQFGFYFKTKYLHQGINFMSWRMMYEYFVNVFLSFFLFFYFSLIIVKSFFSPCKCRIKTFPYLIITYVSSNSIHICMEISSSLNSFLWLIKNHSMEGYLFGS